ncbi:MAG: S-layer homology domain-containing protein [Nitriliruptorales bacterium]
METERIVTQDRQRRRWPRAALIALLLAVALPTAVRASDRFEDLGSGDPHHDSVAAIVDAGITTGCASAPGRYCPSQAVTRGQMGSFLARAVSRGYFDNNVADLTGNPRSGEPAAVTVEAGGAPGGTGYVVLQGSVTVYSEGGVSSCPCEVEAFVYRASDDAQGPSAWTQLPGEVTAGGRAATSLAVSWAVAVPTGTSQTYRVAVFVNDGNPSGARAEAALSAVYVPFGEAP